MYVHSRTPWLGVFQRPIVESVLRNIDQLSTTTERKVVMTTREMREVSGIDQGKLLFGHDRVLCVGLESKISECECKAAQGG